jgi:hypothetical protein
VDNVGKPGRTFHQNSNAHMQFKRMLPVMTTPPAQSPNASQTKFPSASDGLSGNQTRMDSRSSIPGPIDLQVEGTDDDSDLMARQTIRRDRSQGQRIIQFRVGKRPRRGNRSYAGPPRTHRTSYYGNTGADSRRFRCKSSPCGLCDVRILGCAD